MSEDVSSCDVKKPYLVVGVMVASEMTTSNTYDDNRDPISQTSMTQISRWLPGARHHQACHHHQGCHHHLFASAHRRESRP